MICPNLNDPLVKQEFDTLVAKIGEDAAYNAWYLYEGNVPTVEKNIPSFKPISNQKTSEEGRIVSEKTIRDLAARMADRIGIDYRLISDRTQKFKGKLELGVHGSIRENNKDTAVINLAYATLDTPIHEILGHPIIRAIKNNVKEVSLNEHVEFNNYIQGLLKEGLTEKEALDLANKKYLPKQNKLYQNLLKELEYGKGKEVLDRIKRDYKIKLVKGTERDIENLKTWKEALAKNPNDAVARDWYQNIAKKIEYGPYTLEEQQEEAIVELLGMMTADKLDAVKDGKLISLLKRLLKEIKYFVKQLLKQREVEIDKLPDNMTIGDIADLLAYSNSKLILPGYEVEYTTPDNNKFKTYAEASNHISQLVKNIEDIDLNIINLQNENFTINIKDVPKEFFIDEGPGSYIIYKNGTWYGNYDRESALDDGVSLTEESVKNLYRQYLNINRIDDFITKNKEYEQSKEIIEEWKKVNNIQYNPEEIYSRGQEFTSVLGAYSAFDVNLMMQNLLLHIEDNQKAGGEFIISAFTKPINKHLRHLEGEGGKIKFKIYPQSNDIKWAANSDVYSGSVWDASEKVNKNKKSELLGVSYTKYPALDNISFVQPNLASIVDNLSHHHNELGISLTGSNFRLEYDYDIPYETKKLIDSVNSILDQKYGKLVEPKINNVISSEIFEEIASLELLKTEDFNAPDGVELFSAQDKERLKYLKSLLKEGIQPTQTNETLKESIISVANKLDNRDKLLPTKFLIKGKNKGYSTDTWFYKENGEWYMKYVPYDAPFDTKVESYDITKMSDAGLSIEEVWESYIKENPNSINLEQKEYTSQALINTKIAKLKEVAKKYPRSLIRSEVKRNPFALIRERTYESPEWITGDMPFQKISSTEEDEEFIPSFKPKPSNTLSLLKQEEFKNSLTVGEKAQPFLYWSETTSKQVAEKDVIVDRILNDRFEGRYADTGEERTFKFANVIDESLERGMTRNQQKFYKNNLVLGETIDVETQQETYRGEVVEIGEEEVQIKDANGAIIAIPYNVIFKPNAQMKLAKVVQKLKQTFSTQLAIYRRSPKSAEQQKRIQSYETILKTLEDYNQIEDFTVFLEETNKALFRAKTILDRVVEPNNVESNEKKLYVISYVKDLLNSFKNIKDLSTIIESFDGSDILKGYMEEFNNKLALAETTFKDVAIPQLASLLWEYYDPRLNDKMIEVGLDPYTKERLIDELSDPSRDIDFFNQVFVAPSNVNDVIMGLFVKMIKGGKEQARLQDAKFLTNIVPLVEKVKKKFGHEKFKEILKTFYTIVPVKEERDGQEVIINTREFVRENDFSSYYNTLKEFKKLINAAEAKKAQAEASLEIEFTPEMNGQRLDAEGEIRALKRERAIFYNTYGIPVSPEKLKKKMDNNYMWDPEVFYDDLKNYYTQVTDPDSIAELDPETAISIQNEATGELEHYIRNERPRSEPNPEHPDYITKEWDALTGKGADEDIKNLFKALIEEYNAANRKLPYTRRIKDNKVPCLKKQDRIQELKNVWDKITQAISEGKFFSRAYAKIRNEIRDFLKTGSPQYKRRMDGKPYREIPIGVTTVMDVEDSSDDIIMSTLMFVREANNFAYMNNFVGSSEVIIDVLSIQDPLNEEQKEGVEVEINRRKEALLSFFKQQIYGELNTTHGPLSKTIDFLGKATALTTIGLNPKSWLGNFFVGNWSNLAEGFGGRFFTISDIWWADKQFMKMLWNEKDRQKLMNMINSLDAIQGRFTKNFGAELMSFKEKYGKLDNLFIGQDLAEIQIQGTAMLAMLKSQGITIPEDGIFTEENTPDLQNFKNLLHAVNKRNHGVYNDFDRLHFQTNAVFRLFLQFRKWVVSTFRARYAGVMSGEYRIDIEMGTVEKGWYRLTYEYFRDSLANGMSLVGAIRNINDPNLTDVQREGLRRSLVDFLGFVIGSMLILAMTWGDDDDEEDFVGEYFIIYYLMRMVSEIGVYLPFLGFSDKLRMVANPFGAAGTLKDIIGLFGLVMDFEIDKDGNVSIFKEYQRDTGNFQKGDLKLWGKMSELAVVSNILEITDPKQLIENFEAAARM